MRFQETKRRKANGKMGKWEKGQKQGAKNCIQKVLKKKWKERKKHQTPKIPICLDFKLKLVRFLQITN